MTNIRVINVKLPFIEAIENLEEDDNAIACICIDDERPCIIARTSNNELDVLEEMFFETSKTIEEATRRFLTIDNVLKHQWQMVYRLEK